MKTVTNQLNESTKIDTNRRNFIGQAASLGIGLLVANASINPAIAAEGASTPNGFVLIEEVRSVWQFFRDRRPETYGKIVEL